MQGAAVGAVAPPAPGGAATGAPASHDAPPLLDPIDQARFEADKRAVYKHPLFPLLALLLERCELATAGAEPPAADAFGADLQAFVQHQRRDRRPFLVDDPEIDGLMIKSIQVLRIHLLELEKVQELCRDFCGRYIACLKTKMQSENLLRTDYTSGGIESNNNHTGLDDHSSSNSPQYQGLQTIPQSMGSLQSASVYAPAPPIAPIVAPIVPPVVPSATQAAVAPVPTPQDYHHPYEQQAMLEYGANNTGPGSCNSYDSNLVVHGSTPIGQIGVGLAMSDGYTTGGATSASCSPRSGSPPDGADDDLGSGIGNDDDEARKAKRGVLPRQATQAMRAWLFQHLVHPYPTEEEKRTLAAETRLTLLQVNNWFINARRRILQPMLDAGSVDKNSGSGIKRKASGTISKRFWPENLSQPHFSAGLLSSSDEEGDEDEQSEPEEENLGTSNDTQPYSLQTHQ